MNNKYNFISKHQFCKLFIFRYVVLILLSERCGKIVPIKFKMEPKLGIVSAVRTTAPIIAVRAIIRLRPNPE